MRVRVFQGRTASQALAAVRDALGEEAVVLGTRRVGGAVEVTAALEVEEPLLYGGLPQQCRKINPTQ